MAELHVQAKKSNSSTWVWILISLVVIAAIVVYLMMRDNGTNERAVSKPAQTSSVSSLDLFKSKKLLYEKQPTTGT